MSKIKYIDFINSVQLNRQFHNVFFLNVTLCLLLKFTEEKLFSCELLFRTLKNKK